jgi:hypothetical protein
VIDPDPVIDSTPPFLLLSTYNPTSKDITVFIQTYPLHSLTQAKRCQFNFANLNSHESRERCFASAYASLDAERLVQRSQHCFVRIRFHLAATLGAMFIACIEVLMETCNASFEDRLKHGDMADTFQILKEVKEHSVAAEKFWQGLNGVIERCREKSMGRDNGDSVVTEEGM